MNTSARLELRVKIYINKQTHCIVVFSLFYSESIILAPNLDGIIHFDRAVIYQEKPMKSLIWLKVKINANLFVKGNFKMSLSKEKEIYKKPMR